ncbi:MAG: DUF4097 domain-containing protein [Subdoligranulum sp.]|nr:DUF4097 domain-containing protein [Subdoligranulum sp.]
MSKGIRTLLSLGAVSAILGLVLSVAGLFMGGRLTTIHVYWDHGPRVSYRDARDSGEAGFGIVDTVPIPEPPEAPAVPDAPAAPVLPGTHHDETHHGDLPAGSVRELEIEVGAAQVVIQTGSGYDLSVEGSPRYETELSGETWYIHTLDDWNVTRFQDDVVFYITVPEDAAFEEVSLTIGAGILTAETLCCEELELKVGAGTMTLTDLTCTRECDISVGVGSLLIDGGTLAGETEIECGMGSIEMELARPAEYGYAVRGGMGSVAVGRDNYSGMAFDTEWNPGAQTFYDIECGMGSVEIAFYD